MPSRAPSLAPVVFAIRCLLAAVDPVSGERIWQAGLPRPAKRLFVSDRRLLVAVGDGAEDSELLCFDLATGQAVGRIEIGFEVSAGLVAGDRLYLAGRGGAACFTVDGVRLFDAKVESIPTPGFLRPARDNVVFRDATGREIWFSDIGAGTHVDNVAIVVGGEVAQPDLRD